MRFKEDEEELVKNYRELIRTCEVSVNLCCALCLDTNDSNDYSATNVKM